jgi:hypothetical protein
MPLHAHSLARVLLLVLAMPISMGTTKLRTAARRASAAAAPVSGSSTGGSWPGAGAAGEDSTAKRQRCCTMPAVAATWRGDREVSQAGGGLRRPAPAAAAAGTHRSRPEPETGGRRRHSPCPACPALRRRTSRCTRLLNLQMLYSACSASSWASGPTAPSRSRDRKGTSWPIAPASLIAGSTEASPVSHRSARTTLRGGGRGRGLGHPPGELALVNR